ncbi:MAG: hypothetical protein RMH81_01255 [Thermomicrobium sp.]|nr:hypothetical protein [Thermomicrobium sp.]
MEWHPLPLGEPRARAGDSKAGGYRSSPLASRVTAATVGTSAFVLAELGLNRVVQYRAGSCNLRWMQSSVSWCGRRDP